MSYNRTVWVNDSLPAINAENLNKIENGIVESNVFRNLFNVGNATISTNTGLNFNKTNNQILINGSSTTGTDIFLDSPNANKDKDGIILKAGTYTATIKKVSGSLSGGDIEFYLRKSNGDSVYNGTIVWIQKILGGVSDDVFYSDTFTLEEETRLHWLGYFGSDLRTFNNLVLQFQIEESTSATEYTPFAGYIVESGSNDNGSWIKFSDGTLIQRGNVQVPADVGYANLTYPIPFHGSNDDMTIIAEHIYTSGSGYGGTDQLINITSPQKVNLETGYIYSYKSDGTIASYPRNISWLAIGKWK